MGRTSKPFALTPAEASALEAAREQFLAWHRDMPQLQPKALADLRKAARAMHRALAPVLDSVMNPTAARLLVRMQITELHQHSQDHYRQLLTWASYTAGLVDTALAPEVRKSRKSDERAHAWVRTAARQWRAAGLPVTAAGRFRACLLYTSRCV